MPEHSDEPSTTPHAPHPLKLRILNHVGQSVSEAERTINLCRRSRDTFSSFVSARELGATLILLHQDLLQGASSICLRPSCPMIDPASHRLLTLQAAFESFGSTPR